MKYYYRDIQTGKPHYTQAPFVGWTEPTGLLNTPYAMFARRSEIMFIPRYLLTHDTKLALPALPKNEDRSEEA